MGLKLQSKVIAEPLGKDWSIIHSGAAAPWSDCLLRARFTPSHDDRNKDLFRPSWGTRTETMSTRATTTWPGLLMMYTSSPAPVFRLSEPKLHTGTPSQTWAGGVHWTSLFFSPGWPL